jgi:hypothetical protein
VEKAMHKRWPLILYFLYAGTLLSGGVVSKESIASAEDLACYIGDTKNMDIYNAPYNAFTNTLKASAKERYKKYFNEIAVCFDFDDTLFAAGREYRLMSAVLPLVISQLHRLKVPLSICSRNTQVDNKGMDRLAIANNFFNGVFKAYFNVADRNNSKASIALLAKGERSLVLLIDDSARELKRIEEPQIYKLHIPKKHFISKNADPETAEQEVEHLQQNYRDEEKTKNRCTKS